MRMYSKKSVIKTVMMIDFLSALLQETHAEAICLGVLVSELGGLGSNAPGFNIFYNLSNLPL